MKRFIGLAAILGLAAGIVAVLVVKPSGILGKAVQSRV